MVQSDDDLARLVQQGKDEAFAELVQRLTPAVFKVVLPIVKSADDVNDVSQETFVHAWRHFDSFGKRADFKTWLTTIAVRCASRFVTRRQRDTHQPLDCDVVSSSPGSEQLAISSDLGRRILEAMGTLTPMERAAFVGWYLDDMPVREIAEALEVDEKAAYNAIFRAVRKLRKALESLVRPDHASDRRSSH